MHSRVDNERSEFGGLTCGDAGGGAPGMAAHELWVGQTHLIVGTLPPDLAHLYKHSPRR